MTPLTGLEPKIMNAGPLLLAGMRESLDQHSAQTIPLLWQKFSPFIGATPHQVGQNCYGICAASYANQNIFFYMAALEVSDFTALPAALNPMQLPAQRYAVFSHNGHVSRIKETVDAIFDQWLPQAQAQMKLCHDNHTLHFIERYSKDYSPETGLGGIEIWLPISQ